MTKLELRKIYLDKRKKLTAGECTQFNILLYNLFFSSIDLSFIKVLHTYLPLTKNNEPDTWMIIDGVKREFPRVRISVPRIGGEGDLENIYLESIDQLQVATWGLQEPKHGETTPAEKIDLIIVPLLAVDQYGHRVGYGKGYYDRLLKKCRGDCKKIGLSFFESVEKISDSGLHDVRLNMCISPQGVVDFDALP